MLSLLGVITTLLDTLGLLLVAAGLSAAAWTLIGPAALLVAGLVVLAGSWWAVKGAARAATRKATQAQRQDLGVG